MMPNLYALELQMRTTLNIDELLEQAAALT